MLAAPVDSIALCPVCGMVDGLAREGFCADVLQCCYRADIRVRHAYGFGGDLWHWRSAM